MQVKRLSIASSVLHWAAYAAFISGLSATVFSLILAGSLWQQATEGTEITSTEWLVVFGLPVIAVFLYGIAGGIGGLIHAFLYNHLQFLPRLEVTKLRMPAPTELEESPTKADETPYTCGFLRYLSQN